MKAWEDLQFHDDYMFKLVMRDKTICKGTIERILRFPVGDIHYVTYEQTFDLGFDSKSVRMDVYVANSSEVVDLEMQMWNPGMKHLVKRSRYYQAVLDADCLCRADSYTDLRRSYVIFICPFDIFGEGRHIYTFKNFCVENKDLSLDDERTIVFFNTVGTANDIPADLRALKDYINGKPSDDAFVTAIDNKIKLTKAIAKERMSYVKYSIKMQDARDQGRKEGREEGREEGLLAALKNLIANGNISAANAMTLLGIPLDRQMYYAALLK